MQFDVPEHARLAPMEKRDRKPGYFARLKRRRQLKQSQSEKSASEHIGCPDSPNDSEVPKKATLPRTAGAKTPGSPADGSKSNKPAKKEKRRPPGTVDFIVGPNDSLNSIALNFNITPNKLVQLNKLFCHSVYPGQKLFVPDVSRTEVKAQDDSDPLLTNGSSAVTSLEDGPNCRPARSLRRQLSPNSEDESPATVKFIKMSCKYFTDGMGVVGGVLIVTPNNIMFDPHKSDPLVIEHGCEEYGLICPMEEMVSVALYDDVSRMKLKDALPSDLAQDLCPVYRPGEWERLPSEQDLNPFSRYKALDAKQPIILDDLESALLDAVGTEQGEQTTKSPSDEGFTELEPVEEASGAVQRRKGEAEDDEGLARNSSVEDAESVRSEAGRTRGNPSAREATSNVAELQTCAEESSEKATADVADNPQKAQRLSQEDGRRESYDADVKTWLMERIQAPIEDMLLSSEEKSKSPPMFLCFKVGKPMRKSFATGMTSSPAHSFGSSAKKPEYWFAVPQERVDHLYAFFVQWSPDVYGKEAREQGFVVVEKDELDMIDNFFGDPASCSWEIITIDEAKRRQSLGSCDGGELPVDGLPLLSDASHLLQDTHVEKLACRLPARVQGYVWRLAYSTVKHGTSLKTLYRNLLNVDSPVLLVIKDADNRIFGAFSTHPFRISEHCYGTGETFLYSFCPEIKVYRWTGDNSYFVKGNIDSLQMGGGGGQLGLWLDASLYRGTTTKCATFNNQPLSSRQDFNIHSLEVWSFE
ncbi:nuclear receptor coactivator 7 isoform X1 [Syngnathus scovelli]|uniref:nuclear receptor coactivator 7 isoform X1 n=1 Tax=Syngnathus scovelli TaxID=161590 RepID=UPI00210FAA5A|nr:nuclear receptor coactivator 7 isoform X1 [Syngnathus scovelli]